MDIERIIDEIEQIEEMFEAPDTRPFSATDICCEPKARRGVSPQPVVPAVAELRRLLSA